MASLYEALVHSPTTRLYDHGVAGPGAQQAVLVTPIWQPQLDEQSAGFLHISQRTNAHLPSVFLAPRDLDLGYYREQFPATSILSFDPRHFTSVAAYSVWMTSPEVYAALAGPTWMLLCQTDAVLLRSLAGLPLPTDTEPTCFDYLGAPWDPPVRVLAVGHRLVVDSATASPRGPWWVRAVGRRLRVGNGGLSLRRLETFHQVATRLTRELPRRIVEHCYEDVIFCTYGPSRGLRVATPAQAQPVFAERQVEGSTMLPDVYGVHALARWNPALADTVLTQFASG